MQADEVEPTNLVSDEDDEVDMKDELDLRHEGMSKCETRPRSSHR